MTQAHYEKLYDLSKEFFYRLEGIDTEYVSMSTLMQQVNSVSLQQSLGIDAICLWLADSIVIFNTK